MPTIPLHPTSLRPSTTSLSTTSNPLPSLLHTPSGLALLELQGTIHFPTTPSSPSTLVGNLVFPLYNPELNGEEDTKWMKKVWFYVGENQRLVGEVRRLGKAVGVVRRREEREGAGEGGEDGGDVEMGGLEGEGDDGRGNMGGGGRGEELEIVEIVRFKVVFSMRPEPVSGVE